MNAKLKALGLPPLQGGGEPLANPFPRLRVIWSPLAVDLPTIAANAANEYFPGSPYVDVFGGDIYVDSAGGGSTAWKGMQALYTSGRNHGKPFSIPEWGLTGVDDPGFVQDMCDFLKSHAATESALFYESKPGSRWDIGVKPNSRARYRACVTPLAGPFPAWAAANEPGGGARVIALKLTPRPAAGTAPHTVTFSISAKLGVPIQQWLLVYDDGTEDERLRPAARDRGAHLRQRRRLPGDADRLPVPAVHDRERELLHLGRRHRRERRRAGDQLHADTRLGAGAALRLVPGRARPDRPGDELGDGLR